jgi:hypothetical protein
MTSVVDVAASAWPSSRQLCIKEQKDNKFCRKCACTVLQYIVISHNWYNCLKHESAANVLHIFLCPQISVSIIVIFTLRTFSPTLSVDVYAAVCSTKYAAVFRTVSAPWLRHDDVLTRSLFCDQTITSIVITSWLMIIELWNGPQPAVCQ